jgi:hypothetical protein
MTHPELSRLAEVLERQDREIATLRDALAWYAAPSNWKREVRNVGPRREWTNAQAAFDRGSLARMTLMIGSGQ